MWAEAGHIHRASGLRAATVREEAAKVNLIIVYLPNNAQRDSNTEQKLRFVRNITQWLGEAQFAGLYRFHIKCVADGQAIARLMIIEQRSSWVESGDFPNFTAFQVLSHWTVRKHENMC